MSASCLKDVSLGNFAAQQTVSLTCALSFCCHVAENARDAIKHAKTHIRQGMNVECPYFCCSKAYRVVSSFSCHLCRRHSVFDEEDNILVPVTSSHLNTVNLCQEQGGEHLEQNHNQSALVAGKTSSSYAHFFASLQYVHHVPAKTVNKVFKEHQKVQNVLKDNAMNTVGECMIQRNVDFDVVQDIKGSLGDVFTSFQNDSLRSSYCRDRVYKESFKHVEPISYNIGRILNDGDLMNSNFEYVPILESIKLMFLSPTVVSEYSTRSKGCEDCYSDLHDGSVFKKNEVFSQPNGPPALEIILYQDAFEIVNPLGSAKKRHKLLAVYFTLGNLRTWHRSDANQIQLALLVKETDANDATVGAIFKPLLDDLKLLETEGIDLNIGETVFGSVICILGDNFGSHWLGGFVTNFGSSIHFCRYCEVSRRNFHANPLAKGQFRTISSYERAAGHNFRESGNDLGIKHRSVFNELKFYHVAQPGLPPCLAHDIFEGVVQYDVMLFLKYLSSVKDWFSFDYLNDMFAKFSYSSLDISNKPPPLKKSSEKLDGNASENWSLLRFIPLFIFGKVKDPSDRVWCTLLNLRAIVEICTAPKATYDMISSLSWRVEEYIHFRSTLFPAVPLRPKHHYLLHYPRLSHEFGPLVHCWTLRLES